MIIIYDFDGTLTPYPLPRYPVLEHCGYTDETLMKRIEGEISKGAGLYEAYYKCYKEILSENNISLSRSNICLGAENTQFNNGVIEYFKKYESSKTGIKHYIVTSGAKDYVDETIISELVDGVYGTTFYQKDGIIQNINFLLSDKKKVDVIEEIQQKNNWDNQIVYFGDGLTDRFAFEYVHSIGGINVFVIANEHAKVKYEQMKASVVIDKCFNADFGEQSQISEFVQGLIT